jgi:peptidoglycan/xylan/chitin deacetylase (PgdA/CDA1 family)
VPVSGNAQAHPPGRADAGPAAARRLPPLVVVLGGALVLVGLAVAWMGQRADAAAVAAPGVTWVVHPASNTVTVRLVPGGGPASRQILARSRLTVSGGRIVFLRRGSADGAVARVAVPAGQRTSLAVRVSGPLPVSRTLTVSLPPALRVVTTRRGRGGLVVTLSSALRHVPHRLCGANAVSFPAPHRVAVARSPQVCRARLTVIARDGEQAVVRVAVPALPTIPLYSFASPAGQAIYITVDDGWTPSPQVLAIMRSTHLPVTAFLIAQAARQNLPYWRAFARAGGTIGDHTVSHPDLTRLSLTQATAQWGQARQALGQWLGRDPVMGRPPYGAFDPAVQAAAYRGGLRALVGWSATADSGGIQTWDGRPLTAGEIVLLHWVPGLGHQLVRLLAVIRARHLHPMPLTPASFAGIAQQRHSLSGD